MEKTNTKQTFNFHFINKRIVLVGTFLLAGFFITQMYVMSQVGTKSAEIERIRIEKDSIRRSNEILTAEIDKEKSISSFSSLIVKMNLQEKQVEELEKSLSDDLALSRN